MNKRIENLIVEFRQLMIIKRGLPSGESKRKVRERLAELEDKIVHEHWDEIPKDIQNRLGLRPFGRKTQLQEEPKHNLSLQEDKK